MSTNGRELGRKVGDAVRGYAGQIAESTRVTGKDLLAEVRAAADKSIAQAEDLAARCCVFADQVIADADMIALRSEKMFENMIDAGDAIEATQRQFQEKVDAAIQEEKRAPLTEQVGGQVRIAVEKELLTADTEGDR